MADLIQKALTSRRESKHIEFKTRFDPSSPQEWCEVIKDIVAIANSGGGVIAFGLDNVGTPSGAPVDAIAGIDPADIASKIAKYTGPIDLEFEICDAQKGGHQIVLFVIRGTAIPVIFEKPGTYDVGGGKQRTAFGVGTVYFRHGAKSEPGSSNDIRLAIERQLELIRKSWIKGVRKVVEAPAGSRFVTVASAGHSGGVGIGSPTVRAVRDPTAIPVLLTRDRGKAVGTFVHEEVSDGIFDEINNVIDANRALARGQKSFFLGHSVYYRIYAERHHVAQSEDDIGLLLHSAVTEIYAPAAFWMITLPEESIAESFRELYLRPKTPQIYCLMRTAVLLGNDFCQWLLDRWESKWKRDPQPPSFYWTFREMMAKAKSSDPRLVAARSSATAELDISGEGSVAMAELLKAPERAATLLSKVCMKVFEGEASLRTSARSLDYFAYGGEIVARSERIANSVREAIGDLEAGDFREKPKRD